MSQSYHFRTRGQPFGRGGGNRNDKYLHKAFSLNTLQSPAPGNWNRRNRMPYLFGHNRRSPVNEVLEKRALQIASEAECLHSLTRSFRFGFRADC